MLLKEVSRSAAVAWSPLAHRPHLFASATLAGTMNVDFDPSGKLEIFDISEKAPQSLQDPLDMACVGLTSTSERLHRLAWRNPLPETFRNGLIVGGLGSGVLNIWNPTPLIEYVEQAVEAVYLWYNFCISSLALQWHSLCVLTLLYPENDHFIDHHSC